jgi:hypothetical protein
LRAIACSQPKVSLADIGEGLEDVGVENLGAVRPVEALDEGVLRRFAPGWM